MKIHYRKPTILEQMDDAIRDTTQCIDYFELTVEEFDQNYDSFDKGVNTEGIAQFTYKGILVKVR